MPVVPLSDANLKKALFILKEGGLVALPTETVYGLCCDAANPTAIIKLYVKKERPPTHPVIIHISDKDHLDLWARDIPKAAYKIAEKLWPGPITLVLKKQPHVSELLTGGQDTVALRISSSAILMWLIKKLGTAIAAPSANKFGGISPTTARHVQLSFNDEELFILDGGACTIGIESTIIDFEGEKARILRKGSYNEILLNSLLQVEVVKNHVSQPRVSGSLTIHYAPKTPTFVIPSDKIKDVLKVRAEAGQSSAFIIYSSKMKSKFSSQKIIKLPDDDVDYGEKFYAALWNGDLMKVDAIFVEELPESSLWEAIADRLSRAARKFEEYENE